MWRVSSPPQRLSSGTWLCKVFPASADETMPGNPRVTTTNAREDGSSLGSSTSEIRLTGQAGGVRSWCPRHDWKKKAAGGALYHPRRPGCHRGACRLSRRCRARISNPEARTVDAPRSACNAGIQPLPLPDFLQTIQPCHFPMRTWPMIHPVGRAYRMQSIRPRGFDSD